MMMMIDTFGTIWIRRYLSSRQPAIIKSHIRSRIIYRSTQRSRTTSSSLQDTKIRPGFGSAHPGEVYQW